MHRARPAFLFVIATLVLLGFILSRYYQASVPTRLPASSEIWFEDLERFNPLEDEEAENIIRDIIRGVSGNDDRIEDLFAPFSQDHSPRIVFVSASDAHTRARVVTGTGHGLARALQDAVVQLRKQGLGEKDLRWLRFDVVKPADSTLTSPAGITADIGHRSQGIAFDRSTGLAILPTEVAAWRAQDDDGQLHLENLPQALQARLVPLWRRVAARVSGAMREQMSRAIAPQGFLTESFMSDESVILRLNRGQRIRSTVTPESLLEAAQQAGAYLQRATGPNGKFVYLYLPGTDEIADEYNLVRHAGTVYAMLELYEITADPELFNSAQLAIDYLLQFVREYGNHEAGISVLVSGNYIKLGGVALSLVTLAKYTEVTQDRRYLPVMLGLARYIRESQLDDGSFISLRDYPDGKARLDYDSQYYPGEAILALMRLYALEPQPIWLETAEKAARYLITVRDQDVDTADLTHDHWLLYALNDLYRYRPGYLYLTHAMRISRAITLAQNRDPLTPEYIGSYYMPPRSTTTAVRSEGLLAAHALARDANRSLEAEQIREAIDQSIGFQLQTQIRPEKAMYFENPQMALGGFHKSLDDYEVRIDYVQHNLSAILGYYRLLVSARPHTETQVP